MNIDKTILETLTSKQILFSTQFLENVFLKNKTDILIESSDEITSITTLIKSSNKQSMKSILFFALNKQSQHTIFNQLPFSDQTTLLLNSDNKSLTLFLYKELEPSLQNEFMIECYKKNIELFKEIKKSLRPNISIHKGIIIERAKINKTLSTSYISKLISQITDPAVTISQTKQFALSLQKTLSEQDLETLTSNFFKYFNSLKLKIDSKENFTTYLKFFEVSVPLIVLHPSNISTLDLIIEHFLLSLDNLTSQEWIIKLLNQVPSFILNKCCYEIHHFEKVKNISKRNIYCRYNNLLLENINKTYANNIKEAINQV